MLFLSEILINCDFFKYQNKICMQNSGDLQFFKRTKQSLESWYFLYNWTNEVNIFQCLNISPLLQPKLNFQCFQWHYSAGVYVVSTSTFLSLVYTSMKVTFLNLSLKDRKTTSITNQADLLE